LRRKTEVITVIVIVVVVMTFVLGMVIQAIAKQQSPTYNVVQVYITHWTVENEVEDPIDVQFVISLDLNGDGVFEIQRTSDVFDNTLFEIAPFHLGGPIDTATSSFNFMVEVFSRSGNSTEPLSYTIDGITPINEGLNTVDSSQAWDYPLSYPSENGAVMCGISYAYYVS
jgi:hypothetical protein